VTHPSHGPEFLIGLDRGSAGALHEQLERSLREQVRSGRLAPGTRLPSSRALASSLGISRGVVLEAYAQLTAEGYLSASQGAPTRVASTPAMERPPVMASSLQPHYELDLRPGVPDLAAFPHAAWLRSLRAAAARAPFAALGEGDPRGAPELRDQLMHHLARVRGAAPEPEHTLICAGFTQGFAMLCRTLSDRGLEEIAVEEPGWASHRLIAERNGLRPVPIPVDAAGVDVEALAESGCEVAVITPAHQFPTGVVLSSERRAALLGWAEERDALIVEDDYDSELRYDRVPVGALQGLAPERVCHIGSLSKRLAPGLRLGWVLAPSWLSGSLTYEKALADGGSPALEQHALTDFISRGELERHLRRMRLRYARRRETLAVSLRAAVPGVQLLGIAAGLHVLVLLPEDYDEGILLTEAGRRGLGLEALGWHRIGPASRPGLVLGFAGLSEPTIERAVAELGSAARTSTAARPDV
jgi:GntR family transcriptional regulator/MocR family aminotransferase